MTTRSKWKKQFYVVLALFVVLPIYSYALDKQYVLMGNPEDLINERIYTKYELKADGITEDKDNPIGEFIKYQYPTNKETAKTIVNNHTEQVTENTYRIYIGQRWVKKGEDWYNLQYAEMPKDQYIEETTTSPLITFIKKAFADTIYPEAGDGTVEKNNGTSWSDSHDATTGQLVSYVGTSNWILTGRTGNWHVRRGFMPFDTSSLGSGTVNSASIFVYLSGTINGDNDGNDFLAVVEGTEASPNELVVDDFDNFGTTELSDDRPDISSQSASTWLEITLNEDGIANIDTEGYSYFAFREGHDFLDDTYGGADYDYSAIGFNWSESGNPPYIEVDFTPDEIPTEATGTDDDIIAILSLIAFFLGLIVFKMYISL